MIILLLSNYRQYTTSVLLKRGFEENGHTVFAASPEAPADWLKCDPKVKINDLLERLPKRPDFVIMVEASTGTVFFPQGLLECPIPTVFWAIDNHFNYTWHKAWCGIFDLTLFAQKDYVSRGRREVQSIIEWLPLAADYSWHAKPSEAGHGRSRDAVFVGHLDSQRKALFNEIRKSIPTFEAFSGVYGEDAGRLYAEAKIGFNTCVNRELNMRFFEVLASGAFLVTEDIDAGMRDLFVEGQHFVSYKRSEAAAILKRWLAAGDQRETIAAAGHQLCLAEHLYRHRAESIIQLVQKHAPNFSRERERKRGTARLYLEMAAVLQARPFSLSSDARSWAAIGIRRSGRWKARRAFWKYLVRIMRSQFTSRATPSAR